MSQTEYYAAERRNWWERLMDSLIPRREDGSSYELPGDSLFASSLGANPQSVADVPERVKKQIREEAVQDAFNRLEASLRLLLYATTPGKEPPSSERYQQILSVWRYELEERVNLIPDTYCGAVQRYAPDMEEAYIIDGRCGSGDLLRIRVPCWRMHDRVVVRGEAELVHEEVEKAEEVAATSVVMSEALVDEAVLPLSPEAQEARDWMEKERERIAEELQLPPQ
jgi:hypothetical protein